MSDRDLEEVWRLRFRDPLVEAAFREEQRSATARILRPAVGVALVTILAFGFLDLIAFPETWPFILAIRACALALPVALLFMLTYVPRFAKWTRPILEVGGVGAGWGVAAMIAVGHLHEPGTTLYFVALSFPMASAAIGLLPSGFAASVVRAGLIVLSFPVVALLRRLPAFGPPLPADVVVVSLGTLLLLWFFFTVAGYFREAYQRRTFVTMRLLESAGEKLRSVAAELKRLNEEKSTFLGIAAHDLRNPLGVVLGYAEMLRDDEDSRRETGEMAAKIVTAAERVRDLVAGLIEASAAEAGRVSLEKRPCDLLTIARKVVETQATGAARKDIGIRVEGTPVVVTGDPGAIQQIVENVVSNAIKFSPWKSTVVVTIRSESGAGVVEVEDEGPGVNEADRARLFAKFARLSARPTGGESSTGLGLSIVKTLTEAMGGEASLDSPPGRGARFRVRLPV
ncbi:MAG: HAMP domain-containing histidine kinase [Deltaproteobacteria bacterium]|nr:HAMP domain-containing histidine kinase [Deltaproteobacteria bacterium]